jgi:cyclohexadienyl dehydratase
LNQNRALDSCFDAFSSREPVPTSLENAITKERSMIRFLAALGAVFFLLSSSLHAQETRLDDIIKRGTLRVGTTGDYLPFTSLDKATQTYRGFDIDMAEALGKALGVKVEFVPTTWPNLTKDFEAGDFDIAMGGISITLDRQKKGFFSTPVLQDGKTPIARCTDIDKYATIADIDKSGVRVIVNPGGTNERFARTSVKNAKIDVYGDNVTIFDQIVKGDADVMMTDASETRYQQKLHPGVLCAVHPEKPFDFTEKAYFMQRDVALQEFVDQWLHVAKENGSFKKIYSAWFE